MIKTIFLDLDDVCNRFMMYALQRVGCPVSLEYNDYKIEWGWDVVKAVNTLQSHQYTTTEFWESLPKDIWVDVPESAEFEWLLKACIDLVGIKNVCILTSPTLDPESIVGKIKWIRNHFPKEMHRQFLIGPRKHFCAGPEALLIDDNEENIKGFLDHGGRGILVPRPWNHLCIIDTETHLTQCFNYYWRKRNVRLSIL